MRTFTQKLMVTCLIASFSYCLFSQSYSSNLDINNVNALIRPVPNQFWDLQGQSMYFVPIGAGTSTIFTNTLWIGGFDESDNLHLAAEKFRQYGNDYIVGPLSYSDELFVADGVENMWDTIWEVEISEINDFLLNFNNPDYEIPQSILDWPAHGNTELGQSHNLAPYFDINEDGNYNPYDGDYPNIRGDKCFFFIFNDLCEHTESGGEALGVEVHGMAYAFNCPEDDAFNNSIFLNYKIINRSQTTYTDTYIGLFTDFDIGYAKDDYIGCDVDRGSFYAYNGDDYDETTEGIVGFGENPPAQSATLLGGPYKDSDGIDNPQLDGLGNQIVDESINGLNFGDGIIDNERLGMTGFYYFNNSGTGANPATLDPTTPLEHYNYMRGYWIDNTSLLYGGTGHYSSTNTTSSNAKFMFPGNPSSDTHNWGTGGVELGPWSEETESNSPGDRRGMCSTGPFTLAPNDTAEMDIVFVYGVDINTKSSSNDVMKQNIDIIRDGFINNITPDGTPFINTGIIRNSTNIIITPKIYPNPANNFITIKGNTSEECSVEILDLKGSVLISKNMQKGANQFNIDISTLPEAVYFIKINQNNTITTNKMIVIR
ncbi:MAG: T9SS type A sorting domain-containing protein [Bacteroidales bacterium]|nr:T9SS type A sorting domain-containing protein [Bacteroidales bacterium]